jgi:hypothetical protein
MFIAIPHSVRQCPHYCQYHHSHISAISNIESAGDSNNTEPVFTTVLRIAYVAILR